VTIVVVSFVTHILYYPLNFFSLCCLSQSLYFWWDLDVLFAFHNRRCRSIRNLAAPTLITFPFTMIGISFVILPHVFISLKICSSTCNVFFHLDGIPEEIPMESLRVLNCMGRLNRGLGLGDNAVYIFHITC